MRKRGEFLIVSAAAERDSLIAHVSELGLRPRAVDDMQMLRGFLAGPWDPSEVAVVVDLSTMWGVRALAALAAAPARPVTIAVVENPLEVAAVQHLVDLVLARPLDPAALFARAMALLSSGGKAVRNVPVGPAKGTGVPGPVEGNDLFRRLVEELQTVVLPINAAAILAQAAKEVGAHPLGLGRADVVSMLATGRLGAALGEYATKQEVDFVIERVRALVGG